MVAPLNERVVLLDAQTANGRGAIVPWPRKEQIAQATSMRTLKVFGVLGAATVVFEHGTLLSPDADPNDENSYAWAAMETFSIGPGETNTTLPYVEIIDFAGDAISAVISDAAGGTEITAIIHMR